MNRREEVKQFVSSSSNRIAPIHVLKKQKWLHPPSKQFKSYTPNMKKDCSEDRVDTKNEEEILTTEQNEAKMNDDEEEDCKRRTGKSSTELTGPK